MVKLTSVGAETRIHICPAPNVSFTCCKYYAVIDIP